MSAAVLEANAGISRCPKVGRSTETDIAKFVQPRLDWKWLHISSAISDNYIVRIEWHYRVQICQVCVFS